MDLLEKNPPPDDVVPAPPNLRQALFSVPVCFLFMFHPLFRGCWDLWAQALVTFAWAVLAIFAGLFLIRKTEREDSLHEIQIPLTLFLLVSFLSSSFSRFPHSAVPAFLADGTALAFFVFFLISTPLWRARYLRALAGGGTVAAFLALFQLHLHPHAPPTGPFVNPNLLAAYLLLTLPLTGALLLDETSRSSRLIWGGALLAQTAVLFSTASFMAFLALLAEGLCLALWPASPVSAKRRKILLALTAGAAVGGLVFFRHDWARLIHWEADRTAWWRTAFQMWLNNPLWGVGPGAFGEAYPGYRADPLGLNSLYAHNVFLEWLAERGGAGAGAALFLIFLLWIGRRRNAAENKFTVPVLTAMGGFLFFNAAHFGLSFPSLYWVFWSLAGYLWATAAPPPDRGGRTEKSRRALRTGLLVVPLLFAGWSFKIFRADQCLAQAKTAMETNDLDRASSRIEAGLFWNPQEAELYSLRSALKAFAGDWAAADDNVRKSIRLSPFVSRFHREAGEIALRRGRREEALLYFETASRLLPRDIAPWLRIAQLQEDAGRLPAAVEAYERVFRFMEEKPARDAGWETELSVKLSNLKEKLTHAP